MRIFSFTFLYKNKKSLKIQKCTKEVKKNYESKMDRQFNGQ